MNQFKDPLCYGGTAASSKSLYQEVAGLSAAILLIIEKKMLLNSVKKIREKPNNILK